MATSALLNLPDELLELILRQHLSNHEISVRYSRGGRPRAHRLQDGATLFLVCRTLHRLAIPLLFETVTFGHHAAQLLKQPDDPFSLVIVPANLPMEKFRHVCFDFEYALNVLEVPDLWPWVNLESLSLVDYSLGERSATHSEVKDRHSVVRELEAICAAQKVHFSAYVSFGSKQAVRLRWVNHLRLLYAQPPIHEEPEPYHRTFEAQEVRACVGPDGLLEFNVVGNVQEKLLRSIKWWFTSALIRNGYLTL